MCWSRLGEGVIGDLAGFAAASYRRGIPSSSAPPLLSMVDASVGGKQRSTSTSAPAAYLSEHGRRVPSADRRRADTLTLEIARTAPNTAAEWPVHQARDDQRRLPGSVAPGLDPPPRLVSPHSPRKSPSSLPATWPSKPASSPTMNRKNARPAAEPCSTSVTRSAVPSKPCPVPQGYFRGRPNPARRDSAWRKPSQQASAARARRGRALGSASAGSTGSSTLCSIRFSLPARMAAFQKPARSLIACGDKEPGGQPATDPVPAVRVGPQSWRKPAGTGGAIRSTPSALGICL